MQTKTQGAHLFLFKQTSSKYCKTTISEISISQNTQLLGIVIAIFILLFQHQLIEERGIWQKYPWAIFGVYSEKSLPDYIMLSKHILAFFTFNIYITQLCSDNQCFKQSRGPRLYEDHLIQLTGENVRHWIIELFSQYWEIKVHFPKESINCHILNFESFS